MLVHGELSCLCLLKSKKCADPETDKICNTCSNIFSLHCRETTFIQIDIDSDAILLPGPGSEQLSIENLLSGNIGVLRDTSFCDCQESMKETKWGNVDMSRFKCPEIHTDDPVSVCGSVAVMYCNIEPHIWTSELKLIHSRHGY